MIRGLDHKKQVLIGAVHFVLLIKLVASVQHAHQVTTVEKAAVPLSFPVHPTIFLEGSWTSSITLHGLFV